LKSSREGVVIVPERFARIEVVRIAVQRPETAQVHTEHFRVAALMVASKETADEWKPPGVEAAVAPTGSPEFVELLVRSEACIPHALIGCLEGRRVVDRRGRRASRPYKHREFPVNMRDGRGPALLS
jgi:hypothetical protein